MPQFIMKLNYKTTHSTEWQYKEKKFKMSYEKFEELVKKPTHVIIGILFRMKKGLVDNFELMEIE